MHCAVTTISATFIFGGIYSETTYEYLPKDSNTWIKGKNEIPGGFEEGCAIAVNSEQEIWLIGGSMNYKRILSFNIVDHTFQELPFQLNVGRFGHKCTFIPNTNKILVTGGADEYSDLLDSSEILHTEDKIVSMKAGSMNCTRFGHGMGVVTINGDDKLVVFGGRNKNGSVLDCVELYNTKEEKWEKIDIKLPEPKYYFGFLTVKLSEIISKH